jgi:hypothetical protein
MSDMKKALLSEGPIPLIIQEFLAAQLYDSVIIMVFCVALFLLAGGFLWWLIKHYNDDGMFTVISIITMAFCLGSTITEARKVGKIVNSPRSYAVEFFPFVDYLQDKKEL